MNKGDGWQLVAQRLQLEIERRGVSLNEVARASGVSFKSLKKLLEGEGLERRDRLAALANYLGWPSDAFERIREGSEPEAEIQMSASGANLAELREKDPEYFAQLEQLARLHLKRQ